MNRHISSRVLRAGAAVLVIVLAGAFAAAQAPPSPRTVLGFTPAEDRTIADWGQITGYFNRLAAASRKVEVRKIGKTTLGRPLIAAFISSENNIRNLQKHRKTSAGLADPRTIGTPAEAEALIASGKTIVAISCSIHSTEIVGSQMAMNLAYELASANDPDTREILDNTILILIPSSNPDGIDIVADWYRKTLGTKSEGSAPPELYHHYAGHDNNRDWFMLNLKETQAITKLFWQQWFPQIVYDVHQMGQTGARFVIPPFYDPPNPRIPPLILREVGLIGYKMAADLQARNVAGVATNTTFDTWWHGGFRSAPYYHNSIGILSEAASADLMSPVTITREQLELARPTRGLSSPLMADTAHPDPWKGGVWRPSDINQIEITASRSILQMAAKHRQRYLRNFYDLGRRNLSLDGSVPRAFVVMAGQPFAERVARFIEVLTWQGIEVHRMASELYVKHAPNEEFHEIPGGSFLVFTDQPQKNNVLSLFEKQVYPNRLTAAGEAEPPYDVAGWTLPLQMGVEAYDVWEIRDLEAARASLRKLGHINEARSQLNLKPSLEAFAKLPNPLRTAPRIGLYKGHAPSMDEGWTRFVFDLHSIPFRSVSDADVRAGRLDHDVLVLPADSESQIVSGLSAERYPAEISGGVGEEGVSSLRKFVEDGGRLICFDDSCGLLINKFGLPVKNVLAGLRRDQFYNPGSIVKLAVDTTHPLARGFGEESPAYFISSSAFDVEPGAPARIIARYARKDALMSGWMLGEGLMNGKAALVELGLGEGSIVMFGFRPQHRAQTFATFPFVFNALEKRR